MNTFKNFSQQNNIISLGGSTRVQSIEGWSETVASNPTIIKFSIAPLLSLLTAQRFPNDPTIELKKELIKKAQQKYANNLLFCYNNCSGEGSCQPTGYFGFGLCRCNFGFTGVDCSVKARTPTGLLTNVYSNNTCPAGYTLGTHNLGICIGSRHMWKCTSDPNPNYFLACSLANATMSVGTSGTFCGIIFSHLNILCDNHNPYSGPCPPGYSKYLWVSSTPNSNTFLTCKKDNMSADNLPGTICGFHSNLNSIDHVTCDGYYPGLGKCPLGYTLVQGAFSNFRQTGTLSLCVKS